MQGNTSSRTATIALGCAFLGFCTLTAGLVGMLFWPRSTPAPAGYLVPTRPITQDPSSATGTAVPPAITGEASALPSLTGTASLTPIPSAIPFPWNGNPPAGHIAFTCFINGIDQICLMNGDGSERTQLTQGGATHFYASITPDGESILYSARSEQLVFEIFKLNIATRHRHSAYTGNRQPVCTGAIPRRLHDRVCEGGWQSPDTLDNGPGWQQPPPTHGYGGRRY